MAYVAPHGTITLYKVPAPITPNYSHSIYFSHEADQTSFFNSLDKVSFTNQMYTRTGKNRVRIHGYAENIKYYNYMSFRNEPNASSPMRNKVYYCFIINTEYINEQVTEITFAIDELQTWFLEIDWNECFIERQHSTTDEWGENIEPEPLHPSEYVSCTTLSSQSSTTVSYIMTIGTYNFTDAGSRPNVFNTNTFSGYSSTIKFLYFEDDEDQSYPTAASKIIRFMNTCNFINGAISGLFSGTDMWDILGLYAVPSGFFDVSSSDTNTTLGGVTLKILSANVAEKRLYRIGSTTDFTIPYPTRHGTNDYPYEPKNKKMLTYPYTYLSVETPIARQDYKYELFPYTDDAAQGESTSINFRYASTCNPTPSIIVYPSFYKNDRNCYQYSITVSDFPQLPIYNSSLQGALGKGLGGAIKIGLGALIGGGLGALAAQATVPPLEPFIPSKLDGKTERPKAEEPAALMPLVEMTNRTPSIPSLATHGGLNSNGGCFELAPVMAPKGDGSSVNFRISIQQYGLLAQTAERFDKFLSKYGYAQNIVARPNIHARTNWTYIKTRDCSVTGYCPQSAIATINNAMNNGITWWDRNYVRSGHGGDYCSFDNPVITPVTPTPTPTPNP